MNYLILATALTALMLEASTRADDKRQAGDLHDIHDICTLLESGHDAGSLPPNVALRVDAYLWDSDDESKHLKETWEFTPEHVHRVVREEVGKETVYRRAESKPFDTKNICNTLLDGGIHAIATQEGMGEWLHFVGTEFDYGHRSIEIFVDGKSAIQVGESCADAGLAASNARAFANLYEQLALPARAKFRHPE